MQTEHTLEIKKIIAGGSGLGQLDDGLVVMAPFVLPGELVRVVEKKRCSGHILAELRQVLRSSPLRCQPLCRHFGRCGGCNLQQAPYVEQLPLKREIVRELLERARLSSTPVIKAVVPSPQSQGYRYKVRFHLSRNGEIGFHRMGSNDLIAITKCPLATPVINDALGELMESGLVSPAARYCRQIEYICSPDDTSVIATFFLSGGRKPPNSFISAICALKKCAGVAFCRGRKTIFSRGKFGCSQLFATGQTSYTLHWNKHSFFQVNPGQNRQLVQLVCELAGDLSESRVLDLFCGMGNFSIPLALAGAAVTGVELNKKAISDAGKNAQNAGIKGIRFIAADVTRYLQGLVGGKNHFDVLVLDPPRRGLGRTTELLVSIGSGMIIYISCDPATMMRDIRILAQGGYRLSTIIPVDMFPHTHHIECVAVLEKN